MSNYDPFAGGFVTIPVNDTPSPNDDLGFVSEVEGSGTEGGDIGADIGLRLLSKDADFRVFFGGEEILTDAAPVFSLGSSFDTHPIWLLESNDPDFLGTADGSFELFVQGSNEVLRSFQVRLDSVPEPATAMVLAGLGGLAMLRHRRAADA